MEIDPNHRNKTNNYDTVEDFNDDENEDTAINNEFDVEEKVNFQVFLTNNDVKLTQ